MTMEIGFYMVGLEEKAVTETEDAWHFTGYAAVFGNRDLGGDVIERGAFKNSLKTFGLPALHRMHRTKEDPVGTITDAYEDTKGLYVEGELPKDLLSAREVVSLLKPRGKNGVRGLKGMSIGYQTVNSRRDRFNGKDTRFLTEVLCAEASFVANPMNQLATVDTIKSDGLSVDDFKTYSDREREAHLRALGLSDSWSKYLTKCTREAGGSSKHQREAGFSAGYDDLAKEFAGFASQLQAIANR
jgi:uncharacterized protein